MACTSRSRKTVGYGNVRNALSLIFRSWPVPRMSTNAASTPSAEVPDIKPMTYMGQEPSRPLATSQGNCASVVRLLCCPQGWTIISGFLKPQRSVRSRKGRHPMELGFIGLGKMGMNMVTRLQLGKHRVVAYDRATDLIKQAEKVGCVGTASLVDMVAPIFKTLAPEDGWAYMGSHGAGHYVKMVHNGIEYSMMQGYAEGFELMSKSGYDLDLARIADLWMHGSVVRSWLLELTTGFLKENPKLEGLKGYVQDSGEGRWTVVEAIDKAVPLPTLTAALFTRFRSRQEDSFAEKMLAAMRNAFGGHAVKKST